MTARVGRFTAPAKRAPALAGVGCVCLEFCQRSHRDRGVVHTSADRRREARSLRRQLDRELGGVGPTGAIVSGGLRLACESAPQLYEEHNRAAEHRHVHVIAVVLAIGEGR